MERILFLVGEWCDDGCKLKSTGGMPIALMEVVADRKRRYGGI